MPPRAHNALRIAGGDARGRRLKGAAAPGIRPTTQRVRAAIFNILEPHRVDGARVLDLFAGTGSLGLEALSRGAAQADFVERNPRQCRRLQDNLQLTGYADQARVHCADAVRWLSRLPRATPEPYRLALLDPPYALPDPAAALPALVNSGALTDDAVVVFGHSARRPLPEHSAGLLCYDRRQYGDNGIAFYRRHAA